MKTFMKLLEETMAEDIDMIALSAFAEITIDDCRGLKSI